MTDKPEIKVGQRWVTRGGETVRVLHVAEEGHGFTHSVTVRGREQPYSVNMNGQAEDGDVLSDLLHLATSTIKREVALYREGGYVDARDQGVHFDSARRISEPVSVEFTLLPGESAE